MKILIIILVVLLSITGCTTSADIKDRRLQYEEFPYDNAEIISMNDLSTNVNPLNGVYEDFTQMYDDADYIVSGTIEEVKKYKAQGIYNRDYFTYVESYNVLIEKVYKGPEKKNTMISVMSGMIYYDLTVDSSMYIGFLRESIKNEDVDDCNMLEEAEKNNTPIMAAFTLLKDLEFSSGDEVLLFLTDNTSELFKDKSVAQIDNERSEENLQADRVPDYSTYEALAVNVYPIGGYVPLGRTLGAFKLQDGMYERVDTVIVSNIATEFQKIEVTIESSFKPKDIFSQFPD